jgi:hypothetical protein
VITKPVGSWNAACSARLVLLVHNETWQGSVWWLNGTHVSMI